VTDLDFNKPIGEIKKVGDIRAEPLDIPEGFHWSNINIEDNEECSEVYTLLT
jgi:glycylpeptide N-tetradecanoyltransferase